MLTCEKYKMFSGTMQITPATHEATPFKVSGTWLYKPNYDCWYCNGRSYSAEVCNVIVDDGHWISASERLPERGTLVLLFLNSGDEQRITTGKIYKSVSPKYDGRFCIGFDDAEPVFLKKNFVTYWMPLPESPKESDGD